MSVKRETKEINGKEYLCVQWNAEKAFLMKFKLGRLLGGSLEKLAAVMVSDDEAQAAGIGAAIHELFKDNEPEEILSILKEVICSCNVDGDRMSQANFAADFAGDLLTPYKIFAFVLKVNYSDFFGGSVDLSKLAGILKP